MMPAMIGMLLTLVVVGVLMRGASRWWSGGGADLTAALVDAEAAGIITTAQREQILARVLARAGAGGGRFGLSGAAWLGVFAGRLLAALSWALDRTRRRLIGTPHEVTP
jgi:hypothetical protein